MPDLEERELATDPNETHGASDGHLLQLPQRRITIDAMLAAVAAKKDGYNSSVKESSTRLANLQDKATATKTVSKAKKRRQANDGQDAIGKKFKEAREP